MAFDGNLVASIVLSGGEGKRLYPLTKHRCKPSIPFGRYRLIDIPISHSLHANVRKIFVITQFLSSALHHHLQHTYRLDGFSSGFIQVLSPEQRPGREVWYKGTADAVRQNLEYLLETSAQYFLILSGDQLYNMDFTAFLSSAIQSGADLTIAALPVSEKDASRMGILKVDSKHMITDFVEKPTDKEQLKDLIVNGSYLGSMGIYVFKRQALIDLLHEDLREDFGKHLIPTQLKKGNIFAYIHNGYWEDIGTIESFHRANLALARMDSPLDCYNERQAIFTSHQHLPGPKIIAAMLTHSVVCDGSIVEAQEITNSILGPRSMIKKGCIIKDSIIFGCDHYAPHFLIDEHTIISKAIIDKNVRIGKRVQLVNKQGLSHYDGDHIYIRDGIIIVPQGAHLADGFVL